MARSSPSHGTVSRHAPDLAVVDRALAAARLKTVIAWGLMLLAAGCVTDSGSAGSLKLTSVEWRLVEFQSSDDAIGTIRPQRGEMYTLLLNHDGSVAAGLSCNRSFGRWTSPDAARPRGSLTLELTGMTMAACPPSPLERLGSDLSHVRSFVIQDGRLHLNLVLDGGNYVWAPK